jgi:uncharacterized membrane protein (DUF2068 family)
MDTTGGAAMADLPAGRGGVEKGPIGFRVIGILKLSGGLLMFAAWLGMFRLFKNGAADDLEWAARHLRLDPDNHYFQKALGWVSGLDRKHLHAIEAGTFFYAMLHIVEGTGLFFERSWAGYLTIIATSSLVPFEVYEIIHKVNPVKIFVLIVNLGFVVYVAIKLRQENRERAARRAGGGSASEVAGAQKGREPS